jgi:hypothetical protein
MAVPPLAMGPSSLCDVDSSSLLLRLALPGIDRDNGLNNEGGLLVILLVVAVVVLDRDSINGGGL